MIQLDDTIPGKGTGKQDAQTPQPSGRKYIAARLLLTTAVMLVGMSIYHFLEFLIFPGLTAWQSGIITIIFSTVVAVIAAYFVLHKTYLLLERISRENSRRRKSEETLSKVFLANPDWVIIGRLSDGRYLDVNDGFLRMTGYTREEVIGHTSLGLNIWLDPEDRNELVRILQRDGRVSNHEVTYRMKSGELRSMLQSAERIDLDGEACLISVCKDITDRKRAEEALQKINEVLETRVAERTQQLTLEIAERKQAEVALRDSKKRLKDIINFLPDATFAIDREGKIIIWNKAAEEFTGVKAEDMLGKGNYEYSLPFYGVRHPILIDVVLNPSEEIEKPYRSVKREGGVVTGEGYTRNIKGVEAYILGVAAPLYDAEGNVMGAIESVRNITERKRGEEERERLSKELQLALAAKVKQLSGFLPICTSCKKVRDDSGYWNQIEAYIRDHSEAELSHSICPECAKKVYSEIYEESEDDEA